MADDGMLLNFELPADAFTAPKQKFVGGNWKARLAAKRGAQSGRQYNSIPQFAEIRSEDEELIHADAPPSKRPRRADGQRRDDRSQIPANREFVSSLFTYNPSSTAVKEAEPVEEQAPVEPSNAPLNYELATFTNIGLSPLLASHLLNKMDIKAPTAIQRKSVEQLCSANTDAFIQAETGSGKTLAYLLPIIQRITALSKDMKNAGEEFGRESGLFAMVLAPTRELAKQISMVLENLLSCCHWIVGGTVIGGEKKKSEKARLRKGVNILVATPGRLTDHLDNTEVLDVSKVRWLVLDEGDRLMELGFEKDIQKVVSVLNLRGRSPQGQTVVGLPTKRTTVLCSATLKTDVDELSKIALKDPVSISVDPEEKADASAETASQQALFSAPAQLKQSYTIVPAKQRLVTLVATLRQAFKRKGTVMKCIVFMSCADSVDFHFEILTRSAANDRDENEATVNGKSKPVKLSKTDQIPQGNTILESRTQALVTALANKEHAVQAFRLHGSLQQVTRTATLKAFTKCDEPAVLVCTDVASRGLDLPNIDLVIEYDPPFSKDDHLHRIGRTARAGKDGRATIFLMPGSEEGYVEILKEGRPRVLTHHDSDDVLRKGFSASSGVVAGNEWQTRATDCQLDVERWALEHPKHLEQARRAFQSHVRAYSTHVAAERGIFDMKQLHLGHLAKAFALRDKPGSIRVPGLRPGGEAGKKTKDDRRAQAGKKTVAASNGAGSKRSRATDGDFDASTDVVDERESRRKMMVKMKSMGGAAEFNLG